MLKQSENIVHRLFNRQISCKPSGSQLHKVRQLYENIVPSHTVYDVECPDHTFRKFTNDGQYLIAFSRNLQHLIVYRFNWHSYCTKGEYSEESDELPPKSRKFESFFTQLYCVSLASGTETICKDFFLSTESGEYGIFATCTGLDSEASGTEGAVPGVPSMERIKILIVRLTDGVITDDRVYHDDFIHLSHNTGVFMYEDLLAVLSIRYQCIHILQIRNSGTFVDVRKVGDFCQEDDELLLNSHAQREALHQSTLARKLKDQPTELVTTSKANLDNQSTVPLVQDEVPYETSRGIYAADTGDIQFEGYFRGLLGETLSEEQHRASTESFLHIISTNSHTGPYNTQSLLLRGDNHHHQQQSSMNNVTQYILSSRQQRQEENTTNQTEDSSLTSGVESSTGSRSIRTADVVNSTVVTSSRNEYQNQNVQRAVPLMPRIQRGDSRHMQDARNIHETSVQEEQQSITPSILCGIKQRLLAYIFRSVYEQDDDTLLRTQRLKRFYYHFQQYVELVMWKVQLLDRYHLLIKFGSADGVISRSCDASQQPAFFVVYNFETTQILEFQANSSEDFWQLFEKFADHFRASQRYPAFMNYVTSSSNNIVVREQIREQRAACVSSKSSSKANSYLQIARRTLASLPVNAQSQSPSVYFDHSLFHFDEKLISATERHKPSMEHPIKFISRRRPHLLKFKINPGGESGNNNNSRVKRVASFVFHPILPFAISIQQSFMQASMVNFHFRK